MTERMQHKRFEDRTAVITGAAQGIGKAIAGRLASEGADIVISDIELEAAQETAREIEEEHGVKALALHTDISNAAAVESMVKSAVEQLGSIDILVNNAGITRDTLLVRMKENDWDLVMSINLKGAFLCTKACSQVMMKKRWGRIVNISSVIGIMGNAGQSNYSASKAGIIGLTKSAAKELAGRNITVNAVAPGWIETGMTGNLPEAARQAVLGAIPLKRTGTVDDVAAAVGFLCSEDASYITGHVLNVSGGLLM